MTGNEYQRLAARTIASTDTDHIRDHALHGMIAEVGELHSLYQKTYQGHPFDEDHAKREVGDILWMVAEYCTAMSWPLEEVMRLNIDKLLSRYPDGFDSARSLHRAEDDM